MPPRLTTPSRSERPPRLPPLWAGRRRRHLTLLALTGVAQAAIAGLGAHLLIRAIGTPGAEPVALLVGLLATAAVGVGALRMLERVVAERVSQDYVHQLRIGLVRASLEHGSTNLGVAVARTTNDLSAVRTWVSQGVVPLAVGVPYLGGALLALIVIDPLLGLTLAVPLAVLALTMRRFLAAALTRSRQVRRVRGRLAGHVADTVLAAVAIRSAGGLQRELRRVERLSRQLGEAAISRARSGGALRGAAAATSGLASASAVGLGMVAHLPAAEIAAALTIVGLLSTPIHDLGRVAEFRQTYLAACHVLGPVLSDLALDRSPVVTPEAAERGRSTGPARGRVVISGVVAGTLAMPQLEAGPGDRVHVSTGSSALDSEVLRSLVSFGDLAPGQATVSGVDLGVASPLDIRHLVGFAARGMMLTRSSVARTVAYRTAGTPGDDVTDTLRRVGLQDVIRDLPEGLRTVLRRGGQPLSGQQRALLTLARALYRDPALVVLDHVDADLGREGRDVLLDVLRSYPGAVIVATDLPTSWWEPTLSWTPDGVTQPSCAKNLAGAPAR